MALFHSGVSLAIWVAFATVSGIGLSLTAIFLPLIFVPLVFLTMGCSWFLSSVATGVVNALMAIPMLDVSVATAP